MSQLKVELQETMGSDNKIASAAWTSSLDYEAKKKRTDEDVKRVVTLLATEKHSTPFESVIFRFWIKMPIAIDRQFMTHRLQSASGMSGRYRTMPNQYLETTDDVDAIITKIQPHGHLDDLDIFESYYEICEKANAYYRKTLEYAKTAEKSGIIDNQEYKRLREFYRGVLPQHNMTERVSLMNLRAFCNFMKLRNKPNAQPEIRQIAELMLKEVKASNVCPIAIEVLEKNDWII